MQENRFAFQSEMLFFRQASTSLMNKVSLTVAELVNRHTIIGLGLPVEHP